jgi:hypothetical protein
MRDETDCCEIWYEVVDLICLAQDRHKSRALLLLCTE